MSEHREQRPEMYSSLAGWFHLVTSPTDSDYAEEAAFVLDLLGERSDAPPYTLLELGSGGGNLASHLKAAATLTLTDVSPEMLVTSRGLNPECEHLEGDMRTLRLRRLFDAVVVHDAVMYMTTEQDLRAAVETAFVHTRPGGAAVFLPDCVRETFAEEVDHGGHDGGGRALRYLEWTWDPDPSDTSFVTDYAYLLRDADGSARLVHDRHVCGVFARATWLGLLREAGFVESSLVDPWQRDVFVGARSSIVAP
jgi:SAM-dependent methyltransferase